MKFVVLNILLAFAWAVFEGEVNLENLGLGFVLGYIILLVSHRVLGPSRYLAKGGKLLSLIGYFLLEMLVSNLRLAIDVLTPRNLMEPRIVAVPLDLTSDVEITSLANLLSLTPGTLSLDVSDDRRVLYIHIMYARDEQAAVRAIKNGMERRLRELTEPERYKP